MKIPPFRAFVQPSGLPTTLHMAYDPRGNESNLFVDIPTLTYWYWMMCGLKIDLGYTIDGGVEVPIRHHFYLDGRKFLPKDRLLGVWDMSDQIIDEDLDIISNCWMLLRYPRCETLPQDFYKAHRRYLEGQPNPSLLWYHHHLPANTRFGICFKYLEYPENRDFTVCTLPSDIPKPIMQDQCMILDTIQTDFLGQTIPFYLASDFPDEITGHFDFVHVTPEFFEIAPNAPT